MPFSYPDVLEPLRQCCSIISSDCHAETLPQGALQLCSETVKPEFILRSEVALQTCTVLYGFNHYSIQTPSERGGLAVAEGKVVCCSVSHFFFFI